MSTAAFNAASSKAQRLVTVAEWGTDYWAKMSGGEVAGDSTEVWDGGAQQPDYIGSRAKTSNITVTKPYRPAKDAARLRQFARQVMKLRTTITVQDTDADLVGGVYGAPDVYPDALLVRVKLPEAEAGSGDPDEIELEFSVPGLAPA